MWSTCGACSRFSNISAKAVSLRPLFVGKIGAQHIPVIRELQWRGVLKAPPLTPRYMDSPEALERLERVRGGLSVAELYERKEK